MNSRGETLAVGIYPLVLPTEQPFLRGLASAFQRGGICVEPVTTRDLHRFRGEVVVINWAENIAGQRSLPRAVAAATAFCLSLLLLRTRKTKIVYVVHNEAAHNPTHVRVQSITSRVARALSSSVVHLTQRTVDRAVPGSKRVIIPHGTEIIPVAADPTPGPARILWFGQLRPNKRLASLLEGYGDLRNEASEPVVLEVLASPTRLYPNEPQLQVALQSGVVEGTASGFTDEMLHAALARCTLVVLPTVDLVNSGAALTALGASRPVLLPETEMALDLYREMGDVVRLYTGELDWERLLGAIHEVQSCWWQLDWRGVRMRDWSVVGPQWLDLIWGLDAIAPMKGRAAVWECLLAFPQRVLEAVRRADLRHRSSR